MRSNRSILAMICAALVVAPAAPGQRPPGTDPTSDPRLSGGNFFERLARPYTAPEIPAVRLDNSSRLQSLVRAGRIYLSLRDTIALALENNLDIAVSRFGPAIAEADLMRAEAGGLLRGVPQAVQQGASSAAVQATGGFTGVGGASTGTTGTGGSSGTGGTVITQTGTSIPNLDPSFFVSYNWGHNSRPQANTVTTGLTALAFNAQSFQSGIQKSWLTGTTTSLAWLTDSTTSNNPVNNINPVSTGSLSFTVTQRLLQGFGIAVNNRNIRIAKNNQRLSDVIFRQQVIATVSSVLNLYWDLVSFNEDLRVKRQALAVAQKFLEDQKKQVEIGTIAPIEIVRAEARVAQAQQELTNAETNVLQQETILKNVLSRTGVASPELADVRIVPTDTLDIPEQEPVEPIQDLVEQALQKRPELEVTRINIENTKIGIAGSRSQLLPSLDLQLNLANRALAGTPNGLPLPSNLQNVSRAVDPFFVGGFGSVMGQLFRRNFPDYAVGFQLNIPIRNRTAQADYTRDMLQLRQQELRAQAQINDIRVGVQQALIAVQQARARHEFAVKERILQEQTLDAEQKKYALGASTAFQVIQTQRDLAQAQAAEVAAMAAYQRARTQLDFATGRILEKYNIEIEEAKQGQVSWMPSPIPAVDDNNK